LIHWHKPPGYVLDYSKPPFSRWFVGGETNLCHNAVDRHLAARADQKALIWISTEVNAQKEFTFRQLHEEVNHYQQRSNSSQASLRRAPGEGTRPTARRSTGR
jgi:propionyl-CoA synthetase